LAVVADGSDHEKKCKYSYAMDALGNRTYQVDSCEMSTFLSVKDAPRVENDQDTLFSYVYGIEVAVEKTAGAERAMRQDPNWLSLWLGVI